MSSKWLQRVLLPAAGLALLGASVWFLYRELGNIDLRKAANDIRQFSLFHIFITIALVIGGYLFTLGYDFLAVNFVRHLDNSGDCANSKKQPKHIQKNSAINNHKISAKQIGFAGFISCAFSNSVSLPVINVSGTRFRFYGRWGLGAKQIAYMISFIGLSTWMGLLLITGIICLVHPPDLSGSSQIGSIILRVFSVLFILVVVGAIALCAIKSELTFGKYHIKLPSFRLSVGQLIVGSGDWIFQAAIFYMVLNVSHLSLAVFLPGYFAAMFIAMFAHLPAGLGVFDAGIIALLSPAVGVDKLVAALVLYRVFFHILPLLLATIMFAGYEFYTRIAERKNKKVFLLQRD